MDLFGTGYVRDILERQERYSNPWPWFTATQQSAITNTRACNCHGGPDCCIKVGEREREAAIRADERRKVLAELGISD